MGAAAWYRFLHQTASELAGVPAAELALQLFLTCAHSASEEAGLDVAAYEFFEQVRWVPWAGGWVSMCARAGAPCFVVPHARRRLPTLLLLAPDTHTPSLPCAPATLPKAFLLYEESIPDSRQEVRALHSIMGTLNRCAEGVCWAGRRGAGQAGRAGRTCWHAAAEAVRAHRSAASRLHHPTLAAHPRRHAHPQHRCYAIAPEERAALAHKAASYCAKLLKRTDQAAAVLACSHLYWQQQREVHGVGG